MSFIVEQAGVASSTGRERIMEMQPKGIHRRVPVIPGSKDISAQIDKQPGVY